MLANRATGLAQLHTIVWWHVLYCVCSRRLHAGLALNFMDLHVVGLTRLYVLLQMQYSKSDGGVAPRYDEGEDMVRQLQANQTGVDDRLHRCQIQLFKNRQLITSGDQIADDAPDAAAVTQNGGSDSEGDESELEGGDSKDESEEEEEEEEEEEDPAGAGPSFKAMPQEQIEVSMYWCDLPRTVSNNFKHVILFHHTQLTCCPIFKVPNISDNKKHGPTIFW